MCLWVLESEQNGEIQNVHVTDLPLYTSEGKMPTVRATKIVRQYQDVMWNCACSVGLRHENKSRNKQPNQHKPINLEQSGRELQVKVI